MCALEGFYLALLYIEEGYIGGLFVIFFIFFIFLFTYLSREV